MRKYVPSGNVSAAGVFTLLGFCLLGSILAGLLLFVPSRWIYLLIVFPAYGGMVAGGMAILGVRLGKCRSPRLAGVVAAVSGVGGYAVYHLLGYLDLVRQFHGLASAQLTWSQAQQLVDKLLLATTGHGGWLGFVLSTVQGGVELKSTHGGGSAIHLSGAGVWAVIGFESLVMAVMAGGFAKMAASRPFCERCERWFGKAEPLVPATSLESAPAVAQHLADGKFAEVGAAVQPVEGRDRAVVTWSHCPACDLSDGVLTMTATLRKGRETKSETLFTGLVSAADVRAIQDSL